MAIKTGSITGNFTKYANPKALVYGASNFVNKSGDVYCSIALTDSAYTVDFYGLNLNELSNLKNVTITDVRVSITGKSYGTSSSNAAKTKILLCFQKDYTKDSYTRLGFLNVFISGATNSYVTREYSYLENEEYEVNATIPLIPWMNENLDKVIEGGNSSDVFGAKLFMSYCKVKNITVTVDYTYEEGDDLSVTNASLIYNGSKVSQNNKVPCGQGCILQVGVG